MSFFLKPGSPLYLALPLSWHCHRLLHLQHGERGTNPAKIRKDGWLSGICLVIFVLYIYTRSPQTAQTLLDWEIGFEVKSTQLGTDCQNTCWIICWYLVPKWSKIYHHSNIHEHENRPLKMKTVHFLWLTIFIVHRVFQVYSILDWQ